MSTDLEWLEATLNIQVLILRQLEILVDGDLNDKDEYKIWVQRMLSDDAKVDLSKFIKERGITPTTLQRWKEGKHAPGGFRRQEIIKEGIKQLNKVTGLKRKEIKMLKEQKSISNQINRDHSNTTKIGQT